MGARGMNLVGRVTPCAPFVARCHRRAEDCPPYLNQAAAAAGYSDDKPTLNPPLVSTILCEPDSSGRSWSELNKTVAAVALL